MTQTLARETGRHWWFAGLFLLCILLRIALAFNGARHWMSADSYDYIGQAAAFSAGDMEVGFPGGYPALIALVDVLRPDSLSLEAAVILLNIALSAIGLWLVWRIGQHFFPGTAVPWLAALLFALSPNQIKFAAQVMSEVPAQALLLYALWAFVRGKMKLAGLALGAMFLLRTSLLPMVALLIGWAWWKHSGRAAVRLLGTSLLPIFCMVALCMWRFGHSGLGGNAHMNFVIAHASMGSEVNYNAGMAYPAVGDNASALRLYVSGLVEDPGRFAVQRLAALAELWGPWPGQATQFESVRRPWWLRLVIGLRFPLLILGLMGWRLYRNALSDWTVLMFPALALTVVHTAFFATPRFSFVAEPMLMVAAAPVLLTMAARVRERWRSAVRKAAQV